MARIAPPVSWRKPAEEDTLVTGKAIEYWRTSTFERRAVVATAWEAPQFIASYAHLAADILEGQR